MNDQRSNSSATPATLHGSALAALRALFLHRQLSRADLARILGLNRSSSGKIISELLEDTLVREVASEARPRGGAARSGRPGVMLELVPQAAEFIGAEIGVGHISTLRIDLAAAIVDYQVVEFDGRATPVEEAVCRAVAQAFEGVPSEAMDRIKGFGLSAPAQMDRSGRVRVAPILGWRDIDLAAMTAQALPVEMPVMVENEANSFAFGESYTSSEKRNGVSLFLVMESGVGGGIVIDGRLFRGGHGLAGEIGHVLLRKGQKLEHFLGLDRLLERHAKVSGKDTTTLDAFLEDVQDREPRSVEIAEDWARDLAIAVVAVSRLLDPDRIVLGGSVAALYPMVSARVAHYIDTFQPSVFSTPHIEVHQAAGTGAAFGAACMLHRRFLSPDLSQHAEGSLE